MTLAVNGWIEVSEPGSALVLRIGGELDVASRKLIEPAIMAAVASASRVIMDLEALEFCDSGGIAMFLKAQAAAIENKSELAFRHVVGSVRRVFEITCVDAIFELIE